jgi:hypothetical protein
MALASPRKNITKPGVTVRTYQRLVKSGEKIWENAVVALDPASGKWVEAAADPTLIVYGVARCGDYFDNTAGTNTEELLVDTATALMFASGLVDADEGKTVYVVDDQTFSLSSNGGTRPIMGILLEVKSSTTGFIDIQPPDAFAAAEIGAGSALTPGAALTNGNATIQITAGKWRELPASTLTANRVLTLGVTGAAAGDRLKVTRLDTTAYTYAVVNGGTGAGTLLTFPAGRAAFALFYFDGTDWSVEELGTLASAARIAGTALTDAAATILIGGGNWYTLPAATLTTARTVTLGATGAALGDEILVSRVDVTGFALTIANGGGGAGNVAVLPGGEQGFVQARFDGTDWKLVAVGSMVDDWIVGTALTDTATTTVQRGGRRTSFLLAGTMSQGETITLGTTSAQPGDVIRIIRTSTSAQTAAIVNGGGGAGTLVTLPASKVNFAEAKSDGTNWLLQMCGSQ